MPHTTTKPATKNRATKKRIATRRVNIQDIRTLARDLRPSVANNKKRAEQVTRP